MNRCKTLCVMLFSSISCLIAVDPSQAQTAKQGDPNVPAVPTEFRSPMIIDTVFAAADQSLWGKGSWFTVKDYFALGEFTCDGVSLRNDYSIRRGAWDSGLWLAVKQVDEEYVRVKIRAIAHNPKKNHDKVVNLVFEIMNGEEPLKVVKMPPFTVEDNSDEVDQEVAFMLPVEHIRLEPPPSMRITMTTVDD